MEGTCLEVWAPTQHVESFYRVLGTQLDLGPGAKERWRRRFQDSGTCENLIVCRRVKLRRLSGKKGHSTPVQICTHSESDVHGDAIQDGDIGRRQSSQGLK